MTLCTCGNRSIAIRLDASGQELGQVLCESFQTCPEEERTGVRNDQWLEFLQEGRATTARSAGVPWPLTSGLIELRQVHAEIAKRRASQIIEPAVAVSLAVPPVLLPSRPQGSSTSSRTLGIAALVVVFAGGLLGVHAYHVTRARGEEGRSGTARSPSPVARAPIALAPGEPAPVVNASAAPDAPELASNGQVATERPAPGANGPVVSGPALAEAVQDVSDRVAALRQGHSTRHHADRSSRRETRERRERRAHRERAASAAREKGSVHDALARAGSQAGTDLLQDALAKASASAAPAPSAQVLPQHQGQAPGSSALVLELPKARLPGASAADPKPAAAGVERLLSLAAEAAPLAGPGPAATEALPPKRLGGAAVGRLSVQVAAKVRRCAQQFGFARASLSAQVKVNGATGRVTSLSLSGRFAGSPVEHCALRGVGSLSAPAFRAVSQSISVPVVVH